jgi:hypothetical protein
MRRLFPVPALKRHSYLAAQSGAGKSELLKALLISLQVRSKPKFVTVLVDPHGDLALECARLKYFRDQTRRPLVYIAPDLVNGAAPTLNPFDLCGRALSEEQQERSAQNLAANFTTMLSKGEVRLSLPMKTVLTPLLALLLRFSAKSSQPPTFFDLECFLDDRRNADLIAFGLQHGSAEQQHFLRSTFRSPELRATKFSLRLKLASLLQHSAFVRLLARPRSTWDIPQALQPGTTIIINASRALLGGEVSEIFGRTIVSLLQSHCMERSPAKRVPVFLLLDEAASFVPESLKSGLTEARKFGLHYVLVHQVLRQGGHSLEFQNTLMGNTALKIVGNVGAATRTALAKEMECAPDLLTNFPVGNFVFKHGVAPLHRFRLPTCWLRNRGAMNAKDWRALKAHLRQLFYLEPPEAEILNLQAERQQVSAAKPLSKALGKPHFGTTRPSFSSVR